MNMLPSNPVFVVGFPRSGTTLVQGILATQPRWFSIPETHFFSVVERSLVADRKGMVLPSCLPAILDSIHEKTGVRFPFEVVKKLTRASEAGELAPRDVFETLVCHLLDSIHPGWPARIAAWIEKTPSHANFLYRIFAVYPEARFIHVVRHPVPAIASRISKFPFNRESPPEQLAKHWMAMQDNVESFRASYPDRIMVIRYEDLVKDHVRTLHAISEHLGFAFDLSGLDRYAEVVERLILPEEPWKSGTDAWPPTDTGPESSARLPREAVDAIERITARGRLRFGYEPFPIESRAGAPDAGATRTGD